MAFVDVFSLVGEDDVVWSIVVVRKVVVDVCCVCVMVR